MEKTLKRKYTIPSIEIILLDNEISLSLESNEFPPYGPGETFNLQPDCFNSDPLKTCIV